MSNPTSEIGRPTQAARQRPEARPRSLRSTGLPQLLRLLLFALGALADALASGWLSLLRGESREQRGEHRAERISLRAVRTLGGLKGAYAKLGQFAALRLDVLPSGATEALASLRDRVPPLPAKRIRSLVAAELGAPVDELFESFEDVPLGAASIAQVHRATLRGEAVAVKVQYPWLEASLPADLAILRWLLRGLAWLRRDAAPGGDAERLFDEFAAGLRDELDFLREARVAGEIARNLADDERVVVPEVFASHTTRRVLTMRYHPSVGLRDAAGLRRLGVAPREVLEVLARAYATQVFVDGLFHADPHPGNLFVIDEPGAARAPRVLFVDFGLSRGLEPELRRELRKGLFALMQRDLEAFLEGMQRMQMIAPGALPDVRAAVERMFERISHGGGALALRSGQVLSLKDEAKALLQDTPGLQLPNDLLLYAKTLSYLFALGQELDPEVDMMKLSLPYALRFLAQRDGDEDPTPAGPAAGPAAG